MFMCGDLVILSMMMYLSTGTRGVNWDGDGGWVKGSEIVACKRRCLRKRKEMSMLKALIQLWLMDMVSSCGVAIVM